MAEFTKESLKPCPFCNCTSITLGYLTGTARELTCERCLVSITGVTELVVIAKWNQRTSDVDADLLAACERLLSELEHAWNQRILPAEALTGDAVSFAKAAVKKARVDNNAQKGGEV